MNHKRFQLSYPEGALEVQFNMEFDGSVVTISDLTLNGDFKTTEMPHRPTLENIHGSWELCGYSQRKENNNIIDVREIIRNKYSKDIVAEILRIKEDESPRFII